MNVSFTIVAKNYIGLAKVLEASVKAKTGGDFFVFVADEFSAAEKQNLPLNANLLIAKEVLGIDNSQWNNLSFKYNLVEFCTAIKASCFKYLFQKRGYDKAIYLDPDIMAFNSLDPIYSQLDQHAIVMTPHLLQLQTVFNGDFPDHLFLVNGIFNLGFLGLKNSTATAAMLDWWQNRLFKECYFDNDQGLATDQKWMNFLPSFFEPSTLHICRNAGCNAAPWNFCERDLIIKDNSFFISNRLDKSSAATALVFVHFSGYDYKQLSRQQLNHKHDAIEHYADWEPVFAQYGDALKAGAFDQYMHLGYSYNNFDNGHNISKLHRRIYRRLQEAGEPGYDNLFATGAGSFYQLLKSKGLIDKAVVSADGITNKNIEGFSKKIGYVNRLFKIILWIIGVRRYTIMIRFFRRYFKEENQVFLADKKFNDKLH